MKFLIPAAVAAHALFLCQVANAQSSQAPMTDREKFLMEKTAALEARLAALEQRLAATAAPSTSSGTPATLVPSASLAPTAPSTGQSLAPTATPEMNSWLKDTSLNFYFDGYYSWNPNRPLGRVNLLRAYDVTANNFSINQTGAIIERAPDVAGGRRWGFRLSLIHI